jgi:hypothetical protein
VSDPERWREWVVVAPAGVDGKAFIDRGSYGPLNHSGVSSLQLDLLIFTGKYAYRRDTPEMFVGAETLSMVRVKRSQFLPEVVIAECPLPETLEEVIQWGRMVYAVHGGEHE